jgi:uncharacterized protein YegL
VPEPTSFSIARPRALPVILLADTSGSMGEDGKIEILNRSVGEMVSALADDPDLPAEVHLAVIAFGGASASLHQPLQPVNTLTWSPMGAKGKTPLGLALTRASELLNDESQIRRNAYYPTVVLLSDGKPTDEWQAPLAQLLKTDRGRKAIRLSVGIGADADDEVLRAFASDPATGVLRADQARQIQTFFRWLTVTVASRSRTPSPNHAAMLPPPSLEDVEF